MGFYVSTLRNVPAGAFRYYLYVIDCSGGSLHSRWINRNLDRIGQGLGADASIISGPNDLSREVFDFLSSDLKEGFGEIEGLLHFSTCVLITDNILGETKREAFLVPLSFSESTDEELHTYMNVILEGIITALSNGTFLSYLEEHSSAKFKLKDNTNIYVDSANEIIELKPNIAGIGININALIAGLFNR